MNRDNKGRFARTVGFIGRLIKYTLILAVIVFLIGLAVFNHKFQLWADAKNNEVAPITFKDKFNDLVESETLRQMKLPENIAQYKKEMRMKVMTTIEVKSRVELDQYLGELNKIINSK